MKFDLHVHTGASFDSPEKLENIITSAKAAGIDGIAVTDHNVVSSPRCEGFILIPGCEYATDAGHLLTYFISSPLTDGLAADEKGRYPWREIVRRAHDNGGLVFLAHPYAPAVNRDESVFDEIDGIEGYNARAELSRIKGANLRARQKAREMDLPMSAGSDAHYAAEVGSAYFECDVEEGSRDEQLEAIRTALKSGKGKIYGGRSSSVHKLRSGWYKAVRKREWKRIPLMTARTLRGLVMALLPKKTPEYIAPAREKATSENVSFS